jgi:hypothetical protein
MTACFGRIRRFTDTEWFGKMGSCAAFTGSSACADTASRQPEEAMLRTLVATQLA